MNGRDVLLYAGKLLVVLVLFAGMALLCFHVGLATHRSVLSSCGKEYCLMVAPVVGLLFVLGVCWSLLTVYGAANSVCVMVVVLRIALVHAQMRRDIRWLLEDQRRRLLKYFDGEGVGL